MKIWILIFSAALFVGGTCLGVALQPKLAPPVPQPNPINPNRVTENPGTGGPHRGPEFSPTRFTTELDLSSEQNRELDAIFSESHDEMQALGRAMRSAQDKSRERIVSILSPEQKKKLDELMAEERQKRSADEMKRTVASYQKIPGLSDEQG